MLADSPDVCSEAVFGIMSIISPLVFVGDYKPYFTVYDPDYKVVTQNCEKKIIRNYLIGVTNSFFLKSLKEFPVLVRLDREFLKEKMTKSKPGKEIN